MKFRQRKGRRIKSYLFLRLNLSIGHNWIAMFEDGEQRIVGDSKSLAATFNPPILNGKRMIAISSSFRVASLRACRRRLRQLKKIIPNTKFRLYHKYTKYDVYGRIY